MKTLNIMMKVVLTMGLSITMMACSKKKDSQPNTFRNDRGIVRDGNVYPGGNPRDPQNNPTLGYIFNNQSDFRSDLYPFLGLSGAQGEIEFTSGQLYQNTGVTMQGNVDPRGQSGNLKIYIWDEIALQTGEAYQVSLTVDSGNRENYVDEQQGATIVFSDSAGTVTLTGNWNFQNGTWEGTVFYTNNGQTQQRLGSFIIGECSLIRCQ